MLLRVPSGTLSLYALPPNGLVSRIGLSSYAKAYILHPFYMVSYTLYLSNSLIKTFLIL